MIRAAQERAIRKRYKEVAPVLDEQGRRRFAAAEALAAVMEAPSGHEAMRREPVPDQASIAPTTAASVRPDVVEGERQKLAQYRAELDALGN